MKIRLVSFMTLFAALAVLSAPLQAQQVPNTSEAQVREAPITLSGYRDKVGQTFRFRVTGNATGSVWGTGIYTDDSRVAAAAVHAGLVQPGQTKVIAVEILPGQDKYTGTSANGVNSRNYGRWGGSYRFVGTGEVVPPTPPAEEIQNAPITLSGYRNKVGQTFRFRVTGNATGSVWGTGIYTDDSRVATATVHAGLVQPGQEKVIAVEILPGQDKYTGTSANGVNSRNYGQWRGSYRFVGTGEVVPPTPPAEEIQNAPITLSGYRNKVGQTFRFRVTGNATGSVWGTGIYTDDSRVATAAVHAGLVQPGQEKVIAVEILPGQDKYTGTSANGVNSRNYGRWGGSYRFITATNTR